MSALANVQTPHLMFLTAHSTWILQPPKKKACLSANQDDTGDRGSNRPLPSTIHRFSTIATQISWSWLTKYRGVLPSVTPQMGCLLVIRVFNPDTKS